MEVVIGLALEVMARGVARALRRPRPMLKVQPTYWLSVATVALAAQAIIVGLVTAMIVRGAIVLLDDSLFIFLAVILLPIALFAAAAGIAAVGWMIGVARRVLAFDAYARVEVVVAGVAGTLTALYLAFIAPAAWAAVPAAPSVVLLVVAAVPDAWRHDGTLDYRID